MKRKIAFFSIFLIAANIFALDVPELNERVCDYGGILNVGQKVKITDYLERLEQTSGIQIGVLTVPSLKGDSIERFSMKAAEKWKLGQNKKDNGALLVVALAERKMRIEVGYGLEGILTDTKCGLIIRNIIAPEFRNGNYQAGIVNAVNNMVGLVKGDESLVSKRVLNESSGDSGAFIFMGVVLLYGFIFVMAVVTSKKRGPRTGTGTRTTPYVHHVPRNFGSGGGGFSGGGGSFGGGGASGGW